MKKMFSLLCLASLCAVSSMARHDKLFGPNVYIYGPKDDLPSVGREINDLHEAMFHDQFSAHRYAVLLLPGDYRDAGLLRVPYYMQLAGLGRTPYEVVVSNVHTPAPLRDDNGTCTFWRSIENLSVIGPETYDEPETFKWAVSQAAPMRRIYSERTLRTQWGHGWVSGGFAADCYFVAPAGSDHQQQWYYRNSVLEKGRGTFREEKYNYCFHGVELGDGADKASYRDNWAEGGNVTYIPTVPVVREKPFLFVDRKGRYKVFRP
ncbi:MAG: glycoside hydrolase family 16, partial [Bacteroidaceae bacterium]|nr:glycoside hydrolase family 16 [Bacteroidaceae bacterium]